MVATRTAILDAIKFLKKYLIPKHVTLVHLTLLTGKWAFILSAQIFNRHDPNYVWEADFLQLLPGALALCGFYLSIPCLFLLYLITHGILTVMMIMGLVADLIDVLSEGRYNSNFIFEVKTIWQWFEYLAYYCVAACFYCNVCVYWWELINATPKLDTSANQERESRPQDTRGSPELQSNQQTENESRPRDTHGSSEPQHSHQIENEPRPHDIHDSPEPQHSHQTENEPGPHDTHGSSEPQHSHQTENEPTLHDNHYSSEPHHSYGTKMNTSDHMTLPTMAIPKHQHDHQTENEDRTTEQ